MDIDLKPIMFFIPVLLSCGLAFEEGMLRFAIKTTKDGRNSVLNVLQNHDFRFLFQITPDTSIFEYQGPRTESNIHLLVSELQKNHKDRILTIERVIVYEDILKPEQVSQRSDFLTEKIIEPECFYGMGVPQAWALGYTGKGIVIAVTDVGIHTGLLDLTQNINEGLCYNYINDSLDVTPEFFHNHQAEADIYATHGDQCASIIASEYGNGLCSSGIAFNATLVGLKIFMVTFNGRQFDIEPKHWTRSDIVSRALANNSGIDIYCNAWAPKDPFTPLDLPTKEAIMYGGEEGRRGLGIIYVVPSGPLGNELANNIYTIAVNGIGINGSIHRDSKLSASVITSGLADGSNISARYMLTTTRNNNCVTSFKGVSPATAQVAAIIGLALDANPILTLRDIQHLLIQSSGYTGMEEKHNFRRNGAGRLFHKVLGYGLLNATELVVRAGTKRQLPKLLKRLIRKGNGDFCFVEPSLLEVDFCYSCVTAKSEICLGFVEQVTLNITFRTSDRKLRLVLVSPSGTESVLLDFGTVMKNELKTIELLSVHFWDEQALGNWRLIATTGTHQSGAVIIYDATLTIYGTKATVEYAEKSVCPIYEILEARSHKQRDVQKLTDTIIIYIVDSIVFIFFFMILVCKVHADKILIQFFRNCVSKLRKSDSNFHLVENVANDNLEGITHV